MEPAEDEVRSVAHVLCQEQCAQRGEQPCYTIDDVEEWSMCDLCDGQAQAILAQFELKERVRRKRAGVTGTGRDEYEHRGWYIVRMPTGYWLIFDAKGNQRNKRGFPTLKAARADIDAGYATANG